MKKMLSCAAAVALGLGVANAAWAKPDAQNTTEIGGERNHCWGDAASGTAKLDEQASMGRHSMATQAANKHDGFAQDTNIFGIAFNELNDEGNHGRMGVGNASASFEPGGHDTHPGDGGNGVHAENNATAANVIDPVTGAAGGLTGGQTLACDPELP